MASLKSINTSVTVATSSTQVVAKNPYRTALYIVNDSDESIYLSFGATAVSSFGIRLNNGGGALTIDRNTPWFGSVYAICASGSKVLTVTKVSYY